MGCLLLYHASPGLFVQESLHELSPNTSRNERQEGSLEREGWHDKARRQCVQRWLYECSVRHDGIKETVRAVVVHFYKILNMETDWGARRVFLSMFNAYRFQLLPMVAAC